MTLVWLMLISGVQNTTSTQISHTYKPHISIFSVSGCWGKAGNLLVMAHVVYNKTVLCKPEVCLRVYFGRKRFDIKIKSTRLEKSVFTAGFVQVVAQICTSSVIHTCMSNVSTL